MDQKDWVDLREVTACVHNLINHADSQQKNIDELVKTLNIVRNDVMQNNIALRKEFSAEIQSISKKTANQAAELLSENFNEANVHAEKVIEHYKEALKLSVMHICIIVCFTSIASTVIFEAILHLILK